MNTIKINAPRFYTRGHVLCWVSQVLRTARAVWGGGNQYHLIVMRVMQAKRAALKGFAA